MDLKKALVLSIAGLALLSACGRAGIEENADEIVHETTEKNLEQIMVECIEKITVDSMETVRKNMESYTEIPGNGLNTVNAYVAQRTVWEPEDGRSFYYAWSDIDGNGPPELVVYIQADEEGKDEIHFYIVDERNEIQELSRVGSVDMLLDSLPTGNIYQDYNSGSRRHVFITESSCYRIDEVGYWCYQVWENSLPVASQWEILTAQKVIWKNLDVQTGRLSDEALREKLEDSYAAYWSSTTNRNVYKITDRIQSAQERGEEESEIVFRRFMEKVEQGEPTWALFTRYTKGHDPIPVYVDYDGEDFYGIWDESSTPYAVSEYPYHGFRYRYLKTFLTVQTDGRVQKTIILTDKEDLSPQDLDGDYGGAGEQPAYLILYGDAGLADPLCRATDIVETAKGDFTKRNGVYLIEDGEQLELLSQMVADGEEIELGVDVAAAFYRLCDDVETGNFLWIGGMKSPFHGSFLGDGYTITGINFGIDVGRSYSGGEHIRYDYNSWRKTWTGDTIENEETLEEVREMLMTIPPESISIDIRTEGLDMQQIAESIQECWNRNHYSNYYSVQIDNLNFKEDSYYEWAEDSDALLPFLDLFGEEAGAIMRQTAEEEDSYVSFLRLERIDGLDICSFAVRVSEKEQYHVMVQGEWEDTEVPFQHLVIPSTGCNKYLSPSYGEFSGYSIIQADINFDGRQDLLIIEGSTSGTGGSFRKYRAAVWDEEQGEFVWYPSFPEMASDLELNEKRVIKSYRSGISYEAVCEYGIVDGEYVMTRELIFEYHMATDRSTLSYYEMGVLVKEHDVTDMSAYESETLYPDLNFWSKG